MWKNYIESSYFEVFFVQMFFNIPVVSFFMSFFFFFTIYLSYWQNCWIMLVRDKGKTIKSIHTDFLHLLKIFYSHLKYK